MGTAAAAHVDTTATGTAAAATTFRLLYVASCHSSVHEAVFFGIQVGSGRIEIGLAVGGYTTTSSEYHGKGDNCTDDNSDNQPKQHTKCIHAGTSICGAPHIITDTFQESIAGALIIAICDVIIAIIQLLY